MGTFTRLALIVAVYGALMLGGAIWMVWLKFHVSPAFLQGALWALYLLPATQVAHRLTRRNARQVDQGHSTDA